MKEKKFIINYVVVYLIFGLLVAFLITLNYTRGGITGNIIQINTKPLLVISDLKVINKIEATNCITYINGVVTNKGGIGAENSAVKCIKPIYPESKENPRLTKTIGYIDKDEKINFEITLNSDCKEKPRFECISSCKNC